jgi:hypothetical protein
MKRSEMLDLGEMLVWIGVTLIRAQQHAKGFSRVLADADEGVLADADEAVSMFRERFDRRRGDDSA